MTSPTTPTDDATPGGAVHVATVERYVRETRQVEVRMYDGDPLTPAHVQQLAETLAAMDTRGGRRAPILTTLVGDWHYVDPDALAYDVAALDPVQLRAIAAAVLPMFAAWRAVRADAPRDGDYFTPAASSRHGEALASLSAAVKRAMRTLGEILPTPLGAAVAGVPPTVLTESPPCETFRVATEADPRSLARRLPSDPLPWGGRITRGRVSDYRCETCGGVLPAAPAGIAGPACTCPHGEPGDAGEGVDA